MERINEEQLFKLFLQTLGCCGMHLLKCESRDVEHFLFEEFDSDCASFLHEASLTKLLNRGYISSEIYSQCQLLYKKFRQMEETSMWSANAVKTNSEWHTILLLSDQIKSMICSTGDGLREP